MKNNTLYSKSNFQDIGSIIADLTEEERELLRKMMEDKKKKQSSNQIMQRRSNDPLVLSFSQERFWFLDQFEEEGAIYNIMVGACRTMGSFDVHLIEKSINRVIDRHETLRTAFLSVDGEPVIKLHETIDFKITEVTVEKSDKTDEWISQEMARDVQRGFDLSSAPLFRFTVYHLSETECFCHAIWHHIIGDALSANILFRDIITIYEALASNREPVLPTLPIQYIDYAIHQKVILRSNKIKKQLEYWKDKLKNAPPLELPYDNQRPRIQTQNGRALPFNIPIEITRQLDLVSKQLNCTVFLLYFAAFQILLFRYTQQEDFTVGLPVAGRNHDDLQNLIGCFINTMAIRSTMSGNMTCEELILQSKQAVFEALKNQDVPFDRVLETLEVERNLFQTPVFQVLFNFEYVDSIRRRMSEELEIEFTEKPINAVQFAIDLKINYRPDEVNGWFKYNTDLFFESKIKGMQRHYLAILHHMALNVRQPVSSVPMMDAQEGDLFLYQWNKTRQTYPFQKCVHQLFEAQVEKTPDAVAVIYEDRQLTYAQLNRKANRLAHHLIALGVKADAKVAVCVERSLEMVVGLLAVLKAGGAYVPLDPAYPMERLGFILEESAPLALLTQGSLKDRWSSLPGPVALIELDAEAGAWRKSRPSPNRAHRGALGLRDLYLRLHGQA